MPTQTLDPNLQEFLRGRYIATLGTENADGTIHLTAVWYLFEDGYLFVATSSKSRKVRNIAARQKASLMVDVRKPGAERGVNAAGRAELISGDQSREINLRIHHRYLSAAATEVKVALSLVPTVPTTVMMATEIPAAMRPYSIAVAPDSSFANLEISIMIVSPHIQVSRLSIE